MEWTAPGPGTWQLDTGHFDPEVSRLLRDVVPDAMRDGLTVGMELGGAPLKTLEAAFVNGRMYTRQVPLVGGDRAGPTPPKPVLWALTRIHPTFRRRAKKSVTAIDEQYWMQEFETWEREWKPKLIETNRRFGEVDVGALSDDDLASHLGRLWEHVRWAAALHFRLHSSDLAPIGRLLVAAEDWGLDPREVMGTLAGSSPSTSAPARMLADIAAELSAAGCEPTTLDDIRNASDRAAHLLDEYLAEFGNRVTTGYDLRNKTLAELPDVIVSSVRHAGPVDDRSAELSGELRFGELLEQLGPEHHDEFTDLVHQARTLYGLRDENGPLTFEWPAGVARIAVLEAGRRLLERGAIAELEHVFDVSIDELRALLTGATTPDADALEARCAERMALGDLEPPDVLGPVAEMPDVNILPGRMPEMMRAILLVTTLIERVESDEAGLRGVGIGAETYRGTARVVADADEAFERAEPGDIIVTRLTVPTFNSVLAMAGGVVTEGGGLLSHTAVIARELGLPAVIGVAGALTDIPDGATIELDPVNGVVTLV